MKFMLFLVMLGLIAIGLGCGEPVGGGAGYQYLGILRSVDYAYNKDGFCITTTLRMSNDSFTVAGEVPFRQTRNAFSYVWINTTRNTIRLRHRNITSEHPILEWETCASEPVGLKRQ